MKNLLAILAVKLLLTSTILAEDTMYFHNWDLTKTCLAINEIDSISFTPSSRDTLYIFKSGLLQNKKAVSDIDSILFDHVTQDTGTYLDWDLDMWMPDTFFLAAGNTIKIYNDNVAYIPADRRGQVFFDWTSPAGLQDTLGITFMGLSSGIYPVKVTAWSNSKKHLEASAFTILKVEPKVNMGSKLILAIGNSLTSAGWRYMAQEVDNNLDVSLTCIGTRGSTYLHEGVSGATLDYFCSSAESPFRVNGSNLNFKQYIINNGFDNPDVVRISLGINDTYLAIDTSIILRNARKIIDSLLSHIGQVKILISLPTSACNTTAGWITAYGSDVKYEPYMLRMRILQKTIYSEFSYGKYHMNVDVSYDGLVIDRDNGYPKTDGIHDNGVHPSEAGYRELIRGTLNVMNHMYR